MRHGLVLSAIWSKGQLPGFFELITVTQWVRYLFCWIPHWVFLFLPGSAQKSSFWMSGFSGLRAVDSWCMWCRWCFLPFCHKIWCLSTNPVSPALAGMCFSSRCSCKYYPFRFPRHSSAPWHPSHPYTHNWREFVRWPEEYWDLDWCWWALVSADRNSVFIGQNRILHWLGCFQSDIA